MTASTAATATTAVRPTDRRSAAWRVVFVGATDVVSGAERVMLRYAAAAAERGWSASVVAPSGRLGAECVELGIPHRVLPDLKLGEGSRLASTAKLAARNLAAARQLRHALGAADVVVVNSLMALPAVVAARPRCPVHWLVHDVVTRGDLRRIVSTVSRGIDGAIAVSEASAQFPRSLGIPTAVVHNGVPFPDEPAAPAAGPPIVGISGVLTDWKGQDVFLEAMARVPGEWHAEVLGGVLPKDGDYEARLRARAAQVDLDGRVTFRGHDPDPVAVMRRWTVSVSASREPEAGPLVVKEAMGLGLAVVVTDHGGAPEALAGHGLTAPPDDAPALAAAITRYLGDAELRARHGAGARRRVDEALRLEVAAAGFFDELDRVNAANRSAARRRFGSVRPGGRSGLAGAT